MTPLKQFVDKNYTKLVSLSAETAKLLSLMAETGLFMATERRYPFARPIYDEGQWFDEDGDPEPPGAAYLGILLDKRMEVSIAEFWGDSDKFHRPNALLKPGDIFGAFEACDALTQTPSAQNYTVFSGTPTFYFADPLLDPAVTVGEHSSINLAKKLDAASGTNLAFEWDDPEKHAPSSRGLVLMKALTPEKNLTQWQTHVLLIPISKSILSSNESTKAIALISEIAWQQSTHLRIAGIESYSRSEVMKAVRGNKEGGTFPEVQRADYVRELAAMRQTLLGTRPGFREISIIKDTDKAGKEQLDQHGPFSAFFSSLNAALRSATMSKSKLKWKGPDCLIPHVYVPDYLYSASTDLIYPLWLHSVPGGEVNENQKDPKKDPKKGWKSHVNAVKLLVTRKAVIDSPLFRGDPAYSARRYEICVSESQGSGPLPLRGHARIKPLVSDLPILAESVVGRASGSVAGIIAVQHLMEETLVLFKEVLRRNLAEAETITVIGKPYSSSPKIADRFRQLGIKVVIPESTWQRGEFSEWFNIEVCTHLDMALNAIPEENGAVLLLDDGGSLITAASSKQYKRAFVAVEQTSRGVAAAKQAKFPVVLVACSALKSIIEPEFVARAAVSKLARYHPEVLQAKKIGVIGLGNIGGYLAKYLLQRKDIHFTDLYIHDENLAFVTDVNEFAGALPQSKTRGKPTLHAFGGQKVLIRNVDVVYGCTGKDLGKDLLESHSGQLLVSLSSNDIEYATILKGKKSDRGHHFETVRVHEKSIIAGGFPVTFDRDVSSAPLIEMQLTRALLLAGIEQAINTTAKGPIELDAKVQWRIWDQWQVETGVAASDPGAKNWRAARDAEELGELADFKDRIGSSNKWAEENKQRFKKALDSIR